MSIIAIDKMSTYQPGLDSPGRPVLVSPSDTDELAYVTRAVLVGIGTDGQITAKDVDGNSVVIPASTLAGGVFHPMRLRQILNTGTAATNIWYIW